VITGKTKVLGILGNPVAHSLSPAMHNAAFRVLGLDAIYVAFPCEPEDVPRLMHWLAHRGGGGNVTIPYKGLAAHEATLRTGLVDTTGACNTFWGEDESIAGDNTDVAGIVGALEQLEGTQGSWLIAGTGGSARAAAAAAVAIGARLAIQSRDPARATAFATWAASIGAGTAQPDECTTLINATPLGLNPGDDDPVSFESAPVARVVLDLVYAPGGTPWVRRARERGLRASDGREMLVQQGAAAFTRWFPHHRPPVDAMRGAVHAALG